MLQEMTGTAQSGVDYLHLSLMLLNQVLKTSLDHQQRNFDVKIH